MRRSGKFLLAAVAVAALPGAACFDPQFSSGTFLCSAPANSCPSGYHCATDGACWADGQDPFRGPPDPPVDVYANGGYRSVQVNWFPPYNDNGSAITGYSVTSSPGGLVKTVAGNPPALTTTFDSLPDGTQYTFTVTATSALGTSAASMASSAVSTASLPGAPTAVSAMAPGSGAATVTWTAAPANGAAVTSYFVQAEPPDGSESVGGTSTSANFFLLKHGVSYTFTVTATNQVGSGPTSDPSDAVTP